MKQNVQTEASILWHDYETWGTKPSVDFPVQFAAVRTNLDLDIIDPQPNINWLCKMPLDYLPHPKACLVTGITPFYSLAKGLSEPEFAKRIYNEISQHNTCVAGYNSMQFDEEVTRHLLFRNFFPVYEREYANHNSRWDVIDLVRACYALRPDKIQWPVHQDGKPNFKLEDLSKANKLQHTNAHDALSDVYATIAMAKLIKTQQPKLYDYYWQLKNKHKVNELLQQFMNNIFVYVSGFIKSEQGCCTLIVPVCLHPFNSNSVLCIDLNKPIDAFLDGNTEQLRALVFDKQAQNRPGLLSISVNKCPFVAPIKTLSKQRANELSIDIDLCVQRYQKLVSFDALASNCQQVFTQQTAVSSPENVDQQLYTSEFPSSADKKTMLKIRHEIPEQLAAVSNVFESNTLNQLLFRYKARNYPGILDEQEMTHWQQHIQSRLTVNDKEACLSITEFMDEVESLMLEHQQNQDKLSILQSLQSYATQIVKN